jgi:hypothetical protein
MLIEFFAAAAAGVRFPGGMIFLPAGGVVASERSADEMQALKKGKDFE